MPTNLDPWLAGEAQTEGRYAFNQFECDGEHVNFGINFDGVAPGYLDRSHVMFYTTVDATGISTDPQVVPSAAWQSDTVIQLYQSGTTPYPAGVTLSIYRETPKNQPLVDFTDGSVIDEENLDTGFEQAVYGVAEMVDRFNVSNDRSAQAIAIANEANSTAASAQSTAQSAVTTANNAESSAVSAVTTANNAETSAAAAVTTANGIDGKAQTALDNSVAAVTTANSALSAASAAVTTANGIDGKAQTALDNSAAASTAAANAVTTANGIAGTANTALTNSNTALSTANTVSAKQGLKLILDYPVSAVTSGVSLATVFQDSECDTFEVILSGIKLNQSSAGTNSTALLYIRGVSAAGLVDSATYTYLQMYYKIGDTAPTCNTATSSSTINLAAFSNGPTGQHGLDASIKFFRPNIASVRQTLQGHVQSQNNSAVGQDVQFSGHMLDGAAKTGLVVAVTSLVNCTGFTGSIRVYGYRHA